MAPKQRGNAPAGGPEALGRLVLNLKLKIATLKRQDTQKHLAECERAASDLEACLRDVELGGRPALQLALAQATVAQAERFKEQAKQLSIDVGNVCLMLASLDGYSNRSGWNLVRPALRLLLWLLPEHIPPQLSHNSPSQQPSQQATTAEKQASHKGRPRSATSASSTGAASVDWREGFAATFVEAAATVTLVQSMWPCISMRCKGFAWDSDLKPTQDSAEYLEESLVWLTLLSRLHILAEELAADKGEARQPAPPHPSNPARPGAFPTSSFTAFMMSRPMQIMPGMPGFLLMMAHPVFFWMRGHDMWTAKHTPNSAAAPPELLSAVLANHAEHIAFASWFLPSPHLLTAVGLWSPPALLGHRVASFLYAQLPSLQCCVTDGRNLCAELLDVHSPMLNSRLARDIKQMEPQQRRDHEQGLALYTSVHLVGVTHLCHITVGPSFVQGSRSTWSCTVSAITSGIETVVQNLVSLMQPTVLHYAAVHKGPPFLVPASVMDVLAGDPEKYQSMLLDMQVSSDNELRPLVMKRLQQQQDPPHGAGQVWSKEEEEGAWLTAADHAAQGALLLAQIANPSITDMNVLDGAKYLTLLKASLSLMQVLQPRLPSACAADAVRGRAWATCLMSVASIMGHYAINRWQEEPLEAERVTRDAIALRVLLDQVLPVLGSTATALGSGCSAVGSSGSSSSGGHGSDNSCGTASTTHLHLREDSALMLLAFSAALVPHCITAAVHNSSANKILGLGLAPVSSTAAAGQVSGSQPSAAGARSTARPGTDSPTSGPVDARDDLAASFASVLSLVHTLTSGGLWWQSAKAKDPLLLIEAMRLTCRGLVSAVCFVVDAFASERISEAEPLWSLITTGIQPGSATASHSQQPHTAAQPAASGGPSGTSISTGARSMESPQPGSSSSSSISGRGGSMFESDDLSRHQGVLSVTDLSFKLVIHSWELFCPDICGTATRPAAWLPRTDWYLRQTIDMLAKLVATLDDAVRHCTEGLCPSRDWRRLIFEGPQRPDASQDNAQLRQLALQLAALVSHTPWQSLRAAAGQTTGWAHLDGYTLKVLPMLQLLMCAYPLLRVVCMLAIAGFLSDQQKQGVVALLVGPPNTSTSISTSISTSSLTASSISSVSSTQGRVPPTPDSVLPVEEPAELQTRRAQQGIPLLHMFHALLELGTRTLFDGEQHYEFMMRHLLLAFGHEQLPTVFMLYTQMLPLPGEDRAVAPAVVKAWDFINDSDGVRDIYLGWLQASLLRVIDDVVLSQSLQHTTTPDSA